MTRNSKNFALIGAAGYIAPRHLAAIRDTGNELVAAVDPFDSVGILDGFSQDIEFFTEFERFDQFAEQRSKQGQEHRLHYVSICSPNYLHNAHIRFALRIGADAICEKPLVLDPNDLDELQSLEEETGQRIFNILQLRLHPSVIALREQILSEKSSRKHEVDLTYMTSRGKWYFNSWKGVEHKSGGIAANIGIHFFDMLIWIFGPVLDTQVHWVSENKMAGHLELENANVRWLLSLDREDLPGSVKAAGKSTFRSIEVNGNEIEFSDGFTDLHKLVYEDILNGGGYGCEDARHSIELVHKLQQSAVAEDAGNKQHPLLSGSS